MMKRIFAIFIALVLCLSLFSGCGESSIATKYDDLNEKIVTTIGSVKISQAYYNFVYNWLYSQMSQYEQYYGPDWINMPIDEEKTIGEFIEENTSAQIEQFAAAVVMAEEYGIKTGSSVKKSVKKQKDEIIEGYGGETQFVAFLESSRTTDAAVTQYIEMYEIYNLLTEKLTEKGEAAYVPEKEIEEAFYAEYDGKLRVQHILVSTQEQVDETTGETTPARTDEEAQKIVKEIIEKLDKGEDFDSLIEEYNEDPGMEKGKFYVFGDGEMVEEFETASKNLKVGEYTKEGVKTSYGYHIIKKYEINTEIDEYDTFKTTKLQEKLTEVLEKKVKKLEVKWDEKAIDAYLEEWAKDRAAEAEAAGAVSDSGVVLPDEEELEATETETDADAEGEKE